MTSPLRAGTSRILWSEAAISGTTDGCGRGEGYGDGSGGAGTEGEVEVEVGGVQPLGVNGALGVFYGGQDGVGSLELGGVFYGYGHGIEGSGTGVAEFEGADGGGRGLVGADQALDVQEGANDQYERSPGA